MAKTKLTVTTPVGTFTRTTARTYTHLVAVSTYTDAYITQGDAGYSADAGYSDETRAWWQQRKADAAEWHVLGWAGRLDLARKVATSYQAGLYVHVRIFDVATGQEVR